MIIAGIQKVSVVDFPGRVCATIFTQGCNFCCPYCHNPQLWDRAADGVHSTPDLLTFLRKRQRVLRAVCISGGEPTLHEDLPDVLAGIKALGYAVKLDTNGSHPEVLERLIQRGLLDYIAIDLKAPESKYALLAGKSVNFTAILTSLRFLEHSGLDYQVRTTYVPPLLAESDLDRIRTLLKHPDRYHVQSFRPPGAAPQLLTVRNSDKNFETIVPKECLCCTTLPCQTLL